MADDLNTEIKIGADASGVEAGVSRAKRSLADLGASAKKAGQEAGDGIASVGDGGDKAARKLAAATGRMRSDLQKVLAEQQAGEKGSRAYYEALADARGISRNSIRPILDQIDAAKAKTLAAQEAADSWRSSFGRIGPVVATAFSGAALAGFAGKVVSVQRELDVLNSSLKTVTGSSAAAEKELSWLKDFAKETPFGLAQATQGFVKMKALGLDPTRASLTSFGNTASAMGKDLNQMIEAVADASTGEFERLKEFGIKAKKEGDSVSLTFQGVTKTVKNEAGEIVKYLESIGNVQFAGAMEERAKTLDGNIAALGDTWDELFRTVSTNNVGGLIFDSVTLANGAIEDATTILKAMGGAAKEASDGTGSLATIQNGIATVFETVSVLGVNLKYTLVGIGNEIGGLAAQAAQAAQFNFSGVAAIRRQMVADAEAARKEVDATTARILNARKEQERYASYATRNASAATDPRRVDLGRTNPSGGTPPGQPKKEDLSDYDKLIQKLGQELPKAAAEAEAAQNGYNRAQAEFLALAGSDIWAKFTDSQRANVAALYQNKIVSEQAADAAKTLAKGSIDAAQAREKYLASLESGITKIRADITAQEDATARMGLTKQAVADLDAAKLEMLATDAELQAIKALDRNLDQQTYDSLKEQAKLYRDLAAAKRVGAAKETALEIEKANEEAARKAADDWQRTADDINRSLTDALLRGFESGKGFAENLRDTVKNMFSTLVLRPVVSAIMNPVAGMVGGVVNSGMSALGLAGNIASGASMFSGLTSGTGMLGTVGGWLGLGGGSAATAGLISGAGSTGLGLTAGGGLGLSAGGGGLGLSLGSGSAAGAAGASTGGLAGLLSNPITMGLGAVAALALLSKLGKGETRTGGQFGVAFDGSVTNQRRGQTYTIEGQQFDRDFTNGLQTALKDGIAYRLEGDPVAQESAIREAVAGTASGINGFLKALGSAATLTGFSAGLETSGKGRGGVFAGGLLSTGQGFGESGRGDNYAGTLYEAFSTNSPDFKTALENFTLDLKQSTIQALQTVSDIPETVKKLLAQVDAESLTEDAANKLLETINAQIVGVNQFKDALKGMGLDTLAALSFDAAAGLAEVSGGFDKLLGNLNTYYTNFFTGEEQRANLQRSLAEQLSGLGLQLPDINASNARDQFRALVSAAEKDMSEAGRKTYATLLALSGAFASITEAAQTTTQTLEQQRQAYYGALQDAVSARNKSLQSQLSAAQEVEGTLENLFGILRSNVRELYGEVDGTRGMLASQGSAFIDQALAAAKKSGYLPDADKLAEAISAVRGGIDGGAYTTQFASDRDRLVLAGKLSGLEGIAEKQLTDAQKTVRALETQIEQNEQTLDYWKQQIEIASGTYDGILSVEAAVQQLSAALGGTGTTKPGTPTPGGYGGGGGVASSTPRVGYGAEEALTSFEKFKAWYQGLRNNADPNIFKSEDYQVPDWLKLTGTARDGTNQELFGQYQFFKNNGQYAKDFEQLFTTGKTSYATDGSTLVKSDLSKMPKEVADFFKSDRNSLLSYEGLGLDPVLAYQLYQYGPEMFGLDKKKDNFAEWLRNNKWTEGGIVANNNAASFAGMGYSGYNLTRRDLSTGNIVGMDGVIYTPDGKRVGMASQSQLESLYGVGFVAMNGGGQSSLYRSQVGGGASEADYYGAIKTNLDQAIAGGKSAQWIADAISSTGASMRDVATAYGISVAQLEENLRNGGATNIPKFDVGTNYVPRDMLAYIHEGEQIIPKAYNPAANPGMAGGNSELLAEMRALRDAVEALQEAANNTVKNTAGLPQMADQFDTVAANGVVRVATA